MIQIPKTGLFSLSALAIALAFFTGCQKTKEKESVLAQVGTSTLTLSELRESFPAEFEQIIHREQYLDFIKRWIDDEVIYQQAQKADLEQDSLVARKLAKVKRKLLIEEYLARDNAVEMSEPDEMAMSQYYEMHKDEFRRKVPEIKFAHIRVETSKQASDLRGKINRGDFLTVAATSSLDPNPESYAAISFKKQNEFPSCLSQEISTAAINSLTQPIVCPDGVYLVKILEREEAGSLIPLAEAKEEISGILMMERKDKLMEGRIAKYKEGLAINYNLDQIPGQADTPKAVGASPMPGPSEPVPMDSLSQESLSAKAMPKAPPVRKRTVRAAPAVRSDTSAAENSPIDPTSVPVAPTSAPAKSEAEEKQNAQPTPENP